MNIKFLHELMSLVMNQLQGHSGGGGGGGGQVVAECKEQQNEC